MIVNIFMYILLMLVLLLGVYSEFLNATNYSADSYWFNESQSVQEEDNATQILTGYKTLSHSKKNSNGTPVDPLVRIAFLALLLHILVVGGGIVIYGVVYCRHRAEKRRSQEVKHRLQSPLTLKHVPNVPNCRCHGCLVARQILSGLIVQSIIKERSDC